MKPYENTEQLFKCIYGHFDGAQQNGYNKYHLAHKIRNISHPMLYTKPLQLWVSNKLARNTVTYDLAMISRLMSLTFSNLS